MRGQMRLMDMRADGWTWTGVPIYSPINHTQAGDYPLHRFVRGRMHQAVAALLAHGCDADARNARTGDTALHVAGEEKRVRRLVD